jgi:type II secretory pathway predicted ATPase ExeA
MNFWDYLEIITHFGLQRAGKESRSSRSMIIYVAQREEARLQNMVEIQDE